jgi:hypothetical protein
MSTEYEKLKEELKVVKEQKNRALDLLEKQKNERMLKPTANFLQLDRSSMKALRELADTSPTQFKILMLMAEKMGKDNALMISNKAMQSILGMTRQYVSKSINLLAKNNWIKIMKVGTSNAYFLNSGVFWTDKLEKQRFAEFRATIITTEQEQDMSASEWDKIEIRRVPILNVKDERIIVSNEEITPPDQKDMDLN